MWINFTCVVVIWELRYMTRLHYPLRLLIFWYLVILVFRSLAYFVTFFVLILTISSVFDI